MKILNIRSLICVAVLLVAAIGAKAQADSFDADIVKMQQLNGATEAMFSQIVMQFKSIKPGVTDEQWAAVKKDVFDVEVVELNNQLIPVYKKHFTQDEVQAIIAFYETPAGKKLAEKSPMIAVDSMQSSQAWGMGLFGKIQAYLAK